MSSKRRRYAVAAACVALTVILALLAQAGTFLIVRRDVEAPDAFIVLASHEWERFPALVHVARGTSPSVLLTEPVTPTIHNCAACGARVGWLALLGIAPARVVVLPRRVVNTYDEALAAFDYTRRHPVRRLVIVTSPYHTRRALATFASIFNGTGVSIGVYPALEESGAIPGRWWWGGYDRWYVAYESAALVWYAFRHGISPVIPPPANPGRPDDKSTSRRIIVPGPRGLELRAISSFWTLILLYQ
jgi:hypothetical protein